MNAGFSVMILFAIVAIASIIASKLLPESFMVPPPDMIAELMEKINTQKSKTTDTASE